MVDYSMNFLAVFINIEMFWAPFIKLLIFLSFLVRSRTVCYDFPPVSAPVGFRPCASPFKGISVFRAFAGDFGGFLK